MNCELNFQMLSDIFFEIYESSGSFAKSPMSSDLLRVSGARL